MPTVSKVVNDEHHHNALVDFVQRGELFAAYSNDGKTIVVNWGCSDGYPTGETFARIPVHHADDLVAIIKAVKQTR